MARITESQLVLPALYLMSKKEGGYIKTSDLITELTNIMHPTGLDADILDGRSDTYFSQKVRNLKSHNTLQKRSYATNQDEGFLITNEGKAFVQANREVIDYLFNDDFNYEDVKSAIDQIFSPDVKQAYPVDEIVSEGRIVTRFIKTRERSSRLREIAIEHFSHNNSIHCDCCGFNFPTYYGEIYGKDCIEIHHIKPIFQYEGDTIEQLVDRALQNLLPVCPNCHRVIHKNHIGSENLKAFKEAISQMH